MSKPNSDKFVGCLLGCAIGDAIGCVIESRSRKNAAHFVEEIVSTKNWAGITDLTYARDGSWVFGQYTDDTQLSRELARSIVENGGFDPESFSGRIANIFTTGAIVGGGAATAEAARLLHLGAHWEESGTPPPRAGNGGAMRAGPIGLLHWNNSDALMRDAWNQAKITHAAEMSCATSVAVAMAVAMSLNASRETSHPGERGWWDWLARFVETSGSLDFAEDIRLLSLKHFKKEEKGSEILKWILDEDHRMQEAITKSGPRWDGISPWSRTSTLWALYAFMRSPKDFWKTLHTALLSGGDTDTIAAMACALSGAYNGIDQFKDETDLLAAIHDNGKWNAVDLTGLAVELHELATSEHPDNKEAPVLPINSESAVTKIASPERN